MISTLLIICLYILFSGKFLYAAFGMAKSVSTLRWPSVTGKILSLENAGTSNGEGMDTSELEAKYIYVVNGKEYFSKKLAFGYSDLINPLADRLHKQFSERISVPVYYNPSDPQQAVLLRGLLLLT